MVTLTTATGVYLILIAFRTMIGMCRMYFISIMLVLISCSKSTESKCQTAGMSEAPDHPIEGKWVRMGHDGPDDHVERGRVYLALGESTKARSDFDIFINSDSTNARVYLNRAATNFPYALEAVISDCDKALTINPGLKNAYFMRGIALYETGRRQRACDDFERAIELGFAILREAEANRCSEYWDR